MKGIGVSSLYGLRTDIAEPITPDAGVVSVAVSAVTVKIVSSTAWVWGRFLRFQSDSVQSPELLDEQWHVSLVTVPFAYTRCHVPVISASRIGAPPESTTLTITTDVHFWPFWVEAVPVIVIDASELVATVVVEPDAA